MESEISISYMTAAAISLGPSGQFFLITEEMLIVHLAFSGNAETEMRLGADRRQREEKCQTG